MLRYILALSFLFLLDLHSVYAQERPLHFVIRVDDILSRNVSITPRSIVPFQDTVEARGGKITWGVMPHRFIEQANEDGLLAEELTASLANGHEISQHGFEHVCQLCGQSSHEMYCTTYNTPFSYQEQQKLIEDGMALLEEYTGSQPTSFIPPGHISDETTWDVLQEKGFNFISTTNEKKYLTNSLFNLPPNQEFSWALTPENYQKHLSDALTDIKETYQSSRVYNLFLHDPFIRSGYRNGITLRWMGELMDSLKTHFGDDIAFKTLTQAANEERGTPVSTEKEYKTYSFELAQNYPNPFNPTTTIPFNLKTQSRVKLSIYTITGRKVNTPINNTLPKGEHRYQFKSTNLSSGLYLYELAVDGKTQTGIMSLLK